MNITIPGHIEQKLEGFAKAAGLSREDFLRHIISEKLEDMEDLALVMERMKTSGAKVSHEDARAMLFGE